MTRPTRRSAKQESGRRDLNPRPLQPHCSALPDCATSRRARRNCTPRRAWWEGVRLSFVPLPPPSSAMHRREFVHRSVWTAAAFGILRQVSACSAPGKTGSASSFAALRDRYFVRTLRAQSGDLHLSGRRRLQPGPRRSQRPPPGLSPGGTGPGGRLLPGDPGRTWQGGSDHPRRRRTDRRGRARGAARFPAAPDRRPPLSRAERGHVRRGALPRRGLAAPADDPGLGGAARQRGRVAACGGAARRACRPISRQPPPTSARASGAATCPIGAWSSATASAARPTTPSISSKTLPDSARKLLGNRPFAADMLARVTSRGPRRPPRSSASPASLGELYDVNESVDRFAAGETEYDWRLEQSVSRDPARRRAVRVRPAQVALYEGKVFEVAAEVAREADLDLPFSDRASGAVGPRRHGSPLEGRAGERRRAVQLVSSGGRAGRGLWPRAPALRHPGDVSARRGAHPTGAARTIDAAYYPAPPSRGRAWAAST